MNGESLHAKWNDALCQVPFSHLNWTEANFLTSNGWGPMKQSSIQIRWSISWQENWWPQKRVSTSNEVALPLKEQAEFTWWWWWWWWPTVGCSGVSCSLKYPVVASTVTLLEKPGQATVIILFLIASWGIYCNAQYLCFPLKIIWNLVS